ncbi:MAG: hypothetical protein PUE68_02045 [Kiritimatiellae bacterium]|nr:hypothetical protein [Kiritimatiellia bacterium]
MKKSVQAVSDNARASDLNEQAQRIKDRLERRFAYARGEASKALERLGTKKLGICQTHIPKFVSLFELIRDIELAPGAGMDELGRLRLDKQDLGGLKQISELAASVTGGALGGAVSGGVVAFGAYGAATALASASTGTAIAGLSGVAATNATLAFFGGGSLAAGGLGVAGGMTVLGGVVAGPALLVLGSVMGAKASANLDNARANMAKMGQAEEEVETMAQACFGIRDRADLFTRVLIKLEMLLVPQIAALGRIIQAEGTSYPSYSDSSKKGIAALLATVKAVKSMLDTPLLDEKGALTTSSQDVLDQVSGGMASLNA